MSATLDPVGPIAPAKPQSKAFDKCSICRDPRLADINATLLSKGVRAACRAFDIPLSSTSRHLNNHLGTSPGTIEGTPSRNNATVRRARRLATLSERHLRALEAAPPDERDDKVINGAITAADKAFRLEGEAIGTLKSGAKIDLTITAEAKVAVDAHQAALSMPLRAVLDEAAAILDAQILAGDAHACALVAKLASRLVEPVATP